MHNLAGQEEVSVLRARSVVHAVCAALWSPRKSRLSLPGNCRHLLGTASVRGTRARGKDKQVAVQVSLSSESISFRDLSPADDE